MSDNANWIFLVGQAKAGDSASFDRLVERYRRHAIAYAFTLTGSWSQAEDVAQEAFLSAWLELPALQHTAAFPSWLRQRVFKQADRLRRSRRPTVPLETAAEQHAPHSDLAEQALCRERDEILFQALLSLPEAERVVVALFYLGGHKQAEVADFLNISVAAVKKRLERGRKKLRGELIAMSLIDAAEEKTPQAVRFVEVNRLLRDLVTQLDADPQVAAAYLARWGEDEGLGAQNDAWASLNLHIVVRDVYLDHFAAGRLRYVSRTRDPLLWVEAPQNAPADGYYLMTLYDGEQGPYEVNWYWKALSHNGTIPDQTLFLVNKDNLPAGGPLVWPSDAPVMPTALATLLANQSALDTHREALRNHVSLFWAMWFICARYVIRNPSEERMGFVPLLRDLLRNTRQELGDLVTWPKDTTTEDAPQPTMQAKITLLQTLSAEMETLHPRALAAGALIPVNIVPRAARFLNTVAETVASAAG